MPDVLEIAMTRELMNPARADWLKHLPLVPFMTDVERTGVK